MPKIMKGIYKKGESPTRGGRIRKFRATQEGKIKSVPKSRKARTRKSNKI